MQSRRSFRLHQFLGGTETGLAAAKGSLPGALPSKPATSLLVSLADKTDNAEAILADYRVVGDQLWGRFTAVATARFGTIGR